MGRTGFSLDRCRIPVALHGGVDRSATGVPHDNDQFGSGDSAGILDAPENLVLGNIACNADTEDITDAHVEDEFTRIATIDTTENHGQRSLFFRSFRDLATPVAMQALTLQETLGTSQGRPSLSSG